jgi:2-amino-4-hydroxy-6-hydroxymethyldihydropteridine diphosphokinase
MNKAYLLIGGNEGDRVGYLQIARDQIQSHCGKIIGSSHLYETAPWGKTDQAFFLNQAIQLQTSLNAFELMECLLQVERRIGRIRGLKYGPRMIDIDILLFNSEIIQEQNLIVPHPQLQNRKFALEPLCEIAPLLIHPILKQTITDLLISCEDTLDVKKL